MHRRNEKKENIHEIEKIAIKQIKIYYTYRHSKQCTDREREKERERERERVHLNVMAKEYISFLGDFFVFFSEHLQVENAI